MKEALQIVDYPALLPPLPVPFVMKHDDTEQHSSILGIWNHIGESSN